MGTHAPKPPSATAEPHGMRISRVPDQRVRQEPDGSLAVSLWLHRDGTSGTGLALRLSPAEAEVLHAQLCYALDEEPAPMPDGRLPDCRPSLRGRRAGAR